MGDSLRTPPASFDDLAERYDAELSANAPMRAMRRISLALIESSFAPGQRVLEIGCGTGEEALALARRDVQVLATDISERMVSVATAKASAAHLEHLVRARRLAARDLGGLVAELGTWAFDGAYASFGPLNGEPDLRPVASALAALVRPGGLFIVSVMNRFYALETLWYLLHGAPRQAIRRWRGTSWARISPVSHVRMLTWYYTPWALMRAFAPDFRWVECRALPLLLPPPFLATLRPRVAGAWQRLAPLEERLAPRWPFYALGDHFLLVLRRQGDGA